MKRIGIIGLGNTVINHIEQIKQIQEFDLVGIYDHNPIKAKEVSKKFGINTFSHPIDLIEQSEIVDFISPQPVDIEYIYMAIKSARHLFIENRFIKDKKQIKSIIDLADEANVKVQIAREDRYNPAILKARDYVQQANFIETRRGIANVYPDKKISTALDILTEDLDLVMSFANAEIRKIQTRTNNPYGGDIELLNVRLEFDNACVANINISSLSPNSYSKMAIYQQDAVVNIDLENSTLEILKAKSNNKDKISFNLQNEAINISPLYSEFISFNNSISTNTSPVIGLNEASAVLEVIEEIKSQLS
jgi:predicted dehydrogenase